MAELLREAIEIDEKARAKVEKAQAKKDQINETIKKQKQEIHDNYMGQVEKESNDYKTSLDKSLSEKEKNIDDDIKVSLDELSKTFDGKKKELVKKMVDNVKNG